MVIYALLDSPSVTGAYRYLVRPGEQTAIVVDSQIFPRREVQKIGIAPLTSMFFHGENTLRDFVDFADFLRIAKLENHKPVALRGDRHEVFAIAQHDFAKPDFSGLLQHFA